MLVGNSCLPKYFGEAVKHKNALEVTTTVSPFGKVALLLNFFFFIFTNVMEIAWIHGTRVDSCSSLILSMVEQQSHAPEYDTPLNRVTD